MQAAPDLPLLDPVIALDKHVSALARASGTDLRDVEPDTGGEPHAERLVPDPTRQVRTVRLEDPRGRGAINRDMDLPRRIQMHADLGLHPGEGHRDPLLADEEGLGMELIDDPFKRRIIRDGSAGHFWWSPPVERQNSRRVPF